eukprot:Nk52_evm39s294 gene=Nk52_evmTU39s294
MGLDLNSLPRADSTLGRRKRKGSLINLSGLSLVFCFILFYFLTVFCVNTNHFVAHAAHIRVLLEHDRLTSVTAEVIKLFTERNPGVTVEFMVASSLDTGEYYPVLSSLVSRQSDSFDIYHLDVIWPLIFKDHLEDLYELGLTSKDIEGLNEEALESDTVDGKLIAAPVEADWGALFYREDLLLKYGYSSPPETWDELEAMSAKIQEGERKSNSAFYAYNSQLENAESLTAIGIEYLIAEEGGQVFNDGTRGEAALTNPAAIKAIERLLRHYQDFANPDSVSWNNFDSTDAFRKGNSVFQRQWVGLASLYSQNLTACDIEKNIIDVSAHTKIAPLPTISKSIPGRGNLGGWQLGISKYSKNKADALKVLKFMLSEEIAIKYATKGFITSNMTLFARPDVCKATWVCREYRTVRRFSQFPAYVELSQIFSKAIHDLLVNPNIGVHAKLKSTENFLTETALGPGPTTCDLAKESEYSLASQWSYAMDEWKRGTTVALSLLCAIVSISIVCAFVTFRTNRNAKTSSVAKQTESIPKDSKHLIVLLSLVADFVYFDSFVLSGSYSWSEGNGFINALADLLQLQHELFFLLNWFWMLLLFIWCVYAIIHIFGLAEALSYTDWGEAFMQPSISYMGFVGSLLFIPSVGSIVKVYNCALFPKFEQAKLVFFCSVNCYTNSHYSMMFLTAIMLIVFIPLNIATSHIWQEMDANNVVRFTRHHFFYHRVTILALILCRTIFSVYPIIYSSCLIFIFSSRLALRFKLLPSCNVPWVNLLLKIIDINGILVAMWALVFELADLDSAPAPLALIFLTTISCIAFAFGYIKFKYGVLMQNKKTGNHGSVVFASLVGEMMPVMSRKYKVAESPLNGSTTDDMQNISDMQNRASLGIISKRVLVMKDLERIVNENGYSEADHITLQYLISIALLWDTIDEEEDAFMDIFVEKAASILEKSKLRLKSISRKTYRRRQRSKISIVSSSFSFDSEIHEDSTSYSNKGNGPPEVRKQSSVLDIIENIVQEEEHQEEDSATCAVEEVPCTQSEVQSYPQEAEIPGIVTENDDDIEDIHLKNE